MKILVTGGSGYIGSFMVNRLLSDSHEVVVFDRQKPSFPEESVEYISGDLRNADDIQNIFNNRSFDAIIHFAAVISMGESMKDPYKYFENNTYGSLNLFQAAAKNGVKRLIFSSTAGVYGNPQHIPIPENDPKNPTNPYGESKLMTERLLSWYQDIFGLNSVSLRYFNACGAALDGSRGENHEPETHIIPAAIQALLKNEVFEMYGTDYDTPDGTAVRDYIHVLDLVDAHVLALNKLENENGAFVYNVGTGSGHSNREIIAMIEQVSGRTIKVQDNPRRPGDASQLIADASRIQKELGFQPQYSDLQTIIGSAWKWHTRSS
jgi:UDP-glucose 4-epimerase